jgi:hypothetical protein
LKPKNILLFQVDLATVDVRCKNKRKNVEVRLHEEFRYLVLSADNTVISDNNTVISADNTILSADNFATSADNTVISADNTLMFIPDPNPAIFWYSGSGSDRLLSRILQIRDGKN